MLDQDTIVALATPDGHGAISVIRISGSKAFSIVESLFKASKPGKKIQEQVSHTLHLGYIFDKNKALDQVLLSLFKAPNSYTAEDVIEISCHGSPYITRSILQLFIQKGARMARAGEFTLRAFLNGKMDLSQAEAVTDLIASQAEADHALAMHQLRGGVSNHIRLLRSELIDFASLIELSLDFSEEDIEFADRSHLSELLETIERHLKLLLDSFALGNAIKQGIPVAIIGPPNAGKSTLLNTLLQEKRAIVSDIPGTTRDVIEDQLIIAGIRFRFIDTAGIRQTRDRVEALGIEKTFESIHQAQVIFYLFDLSDFDKKALLAELHNLSENYPDKKIFVIANKSDLSQDSFSPDDAFKETFRISAKKEKGIDRLLKALFDLVDHRALEDRTLITHSRHYEVLHEALRAIHDIKQAVNEKRPGDLLSTDIRCALDYLGEISGEISSEELLGNIFSKFCIGK
ncbi:tRNA uridine-5-carboxymethylaminomethyl(34) synthesis GTPase MnmE [Bacteroidetes bacterium endosymbiont of Geopemphigus sp.]|uniref:tRNA uridine-5-carboxymethylaminomethyl(34) synthesis GTPase MnmE n=1 Tax=Bacteroidetes bacterium endosymbiont of Geopemphigus sp. TaxID=2047937 RepID=UPI000CD005B4|nr:tRNA uridine-5-carboxymethylaminomethyl(34) synthesis GTPase MnmE [Bacteroidetes bacterium endosymbiont of Geopemphigus sp.]